MTDIDNEVIRARAEAATPGPWDTDDGGTSVGLGDQWLAHVVDHDEPNMPTQARADAEFIAHARVDIPALLDEVERLRAEMQRMAREQLTPVMENEMLVTDLAAAAVRLEQWKREALTALGEWEKIWDDLGQPGSLGRSKAAITREWVQAYKADALRLAERLNAVRELADRWEHLTDGPDETWDDEVHALGTSAWHAPVFAAQLRAVLDEHLGGDQ